MTSGFQPSSVSIADPALLLRTRMLAHPGSWSCGLLIQKLFFVAFSFIKSETLRLLSPGNPSGTPASFRERDLNRSYRLPHKAHALFVHPRRKNCTYAGVELRPGVRLLTPQKWVEFLGEIILISISLVYKIPLLFSKKVW
ncbi:hypothetical protein SAMN05421687_105231 [Salimicrobium flavidum]|uniref:Uncharacterized protein n=1 Tax=Salimicrobium flavidum TaxID=570947 RepID=A0A1N7JFM7_9BACI|nr:hypothetical protein SAMN05421687_105231 [Salimicrobium flavidum]